MPSDKNETVENTSWYKKKSKEMVFLIGVAGLSSLFGFSMTLAVAKKKDPSMFNKGLLSHKGSVESGSSLALKALGWGTLYSVGGFSLFWVVVWKLMGVRSMEEFTKKMQHTMPKLPKKEVQGKNDFKDLQELVEYIINDGEKGLKKDKKS